MKLKIWAVVMLFSLMGFVGCTAKTDPIIDNNTEAAQESLPPDTPGLNAKISAETAQQLAAQKDIQNFKSIELVDLDGNKIDKIFTQEEMDTIVTAYNESPVQDTSYTMVLVGYTMIITLEDDTIVTITSYGDENNIVATTEVGNTYHLNCPTIAKILLEKTL